MAGKIITRQKRCPHCGLPGRWDRALNCKHAGCGKPSDRPEIELVWQRKRVRICHDERGDRLLGLIQAERALDRIRVQIERQEFDPALWKSKRNNGLLWQNYVAEYLVREMKRLKHHSFMAKVYNFRHMKWFDDLNIRDITTAKVQDFTAWLASDSGLAVVSQVTVLKHFRALMNSAYEREEIVRVPRIRMPREPKRRIKYLSLEQQQSAISQIPEEHQPVFMFLFQYGVRVGEACALCWDKVDWDKGVFVVARSHTCGRWQEETKTGADRVMPILGWFADWLKTAPRGIGATPVFLNPRATTRRRNYSTSTLGRIWRVAIREAGIESIPLKNASRHSLGFALRQKAGADMKHIANVLGHAKTETTSHYVQDDVGSIAAMLTKIADQKLTKLDLVSKND